MAINKKKEEFDTEFPLSKLNKIKGNRRLAREKILQLMVASDISQIRWQESFYHIFFRNFNFEDIIPDSGKLLTPEEVQEIEADFPIDWSNEEIDFGKKLIVYGLESKVMVDSLIQKLVQNWELNRIAIIDRCLIYIAVAEFIAFPDIPTKVSINEAIDLAKLYSTEKSGTFINGILDAILSELKANGRVNKLGRGLIDK